MPTITVLTPVHSGGDAYLTELHHCLASQRLPSGWQLEWVLQEDGQTGDPLKAVPDAMWISKGTGRWGGASRARTLALGRVTGELLRCIDADDLLPDEYTLTRDIEVLTNRPEVAWTVAPCLDLHDDGRVEPGPHDPAPGHLSSRALLDGALIDELPVMGTTLTTYTALIRVLGGWPALPAYEDAALLLFCEAVAPGWMQEAPGEIYRKHSGQHTASAAFHSPEEKKIRTQFVIDRAEALRSAGWRWACPPHPQQKTR